jgi:hypothetical protein
VYTYSVIRLGYPAQNLTIPASTTARFGSRPPATHTGFSRWSGKISSGWRRFRGRTQSMA